MLKRILKAIGPKEPNEYIPTSSDRLEENFAEIEKIIKTSGSQHSITGNCHYFTIGPTSLLTALTVASIIMILLFLIGGFAGMIYAEGSAQYLSVLVGWGFAGYQLYVTARKTPLGAEIAITIDSDSKLITIFNSNILRKRFTSAELVPFASVNRVWTEPFEVRGNHVTFTWKKVFIEHDNGITQILALPDGYSVYVDAENFITCFTRIIKK